jgi:diguanylate cyclase (GGDEF)-like protein/PAS domain S-box-containing protein
MDKKRPVLIIEDSPTDALIVKHALRKQFDVERVESVDEATALLDGQDFAAVVTDHRIRGGTGLDVMRWMKANGLSTPVIMASGNGDERIATEALKLGAYDYIVKTEESLSSLGMVLKHALARHELEQEAKLLQQIVENAADAIFTMDTHGTILTANRAVEAMFGFPPEAVVGHSVDIFFPQEVAGKEVEKMLAAGSAGRGWAGELNAERKDGSALLINMSMSVMCQPNGRTTCLTGIARDMTERRQLLDKLKRLSVTDHLTGLFNHRFFHDRLRYEFMRARRYGHSLGCMMIDVDYFKSVNDTYGHIVGDEVLKALGKVMGEATRSVDIVARYGGEEFAVLLPDTDMDGAMRCAEYLWNAVNQAEIQTQQGPIKITVSVGVTSLSPDIETEEELHSRADAALLSAKRRGRNNVCVWDESALNTEVDVPDIIGEDLEGLCDNIRRLVLPARERYMDTVRPVLDALCRRHPILRRHSTNVTIFAMELARLCDIRKEEEEALQYAALFHDIGHITTPPEVLSKPGILSPEERSMVENHVEASETLMRELALSDLEMEYVRYHHERYDGTGYPNGLMGEAIPLGARILTVADAYDAMTSDRPYRQRLSEEDAIEELRNCAGTQFDPQLVHLFLEARHALPVAV